MHEITCTCESWLLESSSGKALNGISKEETDFKSGFQAVKDRLAYVV